MYYILMLKFFCSDPVQDRASFDGGNLTISSLLLSDEGNYTCSVFATQRAPMFLNTVLTVTGKFIF